VSPWKVIFATLVIFCSGLVTGAVLIRQFERPHAPRRPQPPTPVTQPAAPSPWHQQQRDLLKRMEKQLDLSTEQRERIEKIMKESQERTKAIREKVAPELREEVKRLRELVRVELTPDQQKTFDEAIKPKLPKKGDDASDENRKRRQQSTNAPAAAPAPSTP
jgi:hypothetical protein